MVRNNIPMDSIVVKMSAEEAIMPMRMSMIKSQADVLDSIKRSIERTKKGDRVIVVGVGNTSGVGNNAGDAEKTRKWVDGYEKKLKAAKKKKAD